MELRVLRYYLAICQEKNITKAASELHISQPSLSRQIHDLEEELGVTLFHRGHRQITLTEEGYYLRDRARELVTIADNTAQTLEKSQIIAGELNIGAGQTPAMEPIMKIVDQLTTAHPKVRVNLVDADADEVEKRIKEGTLNFGIIMGDRPLEEFQSMILPTHNQFVAIFAKGLPLAQHEKITPADLLNYPILLSSQKFVSDKFRKWWGNLASKVHANCTYSLTYNASLLAKQGHQVLITYHGLVNTSPDSGLVERPLSPQVSDPNILIWRKDTHQSNLERLFLDQVHALADQEHLK